MALYVETFMCSFVSSGNLKPWPRLTFSEQTWLGYLILLLLLFSYIVRCNLLFFKRICFIYLNRRKGEDSSCAGSLPKCPHTTRAELGQCQEPWTQSLPRMHDSRTIILPITTVMSLCRFCIKELKLKYSSA